MWTFFRHQNEREAPPTGSPWILVPLGNPGEEYVATRHNLGRLLLQRWLDPRGREPSRLRAFSTGNLYRLDEVRLALVPSTYMNHSGQVCAEAAAAGYAPSRMVLLQDDKDLPLGLGRFRLKGGAGGHRGLASVLECLGTEGIARLRLGIGPYRRPLDEFVLGEWAEEEWPLIDALEAPFAAFMAHLAQAASLEELPGVVNAESFWASPSRPEEPCLSEGTQGPGPPLHFP